MTGRRQRHDHARLGLALRLGGRGGQRCRHGHDVVLPARIAADSEQAAAGSTQAEKIAKELHGPISSVTARAAPSEMSRRSLV
ncbi:hypothetical protein PCA_14310 [Rhodanobacter sp. PCA2]|nr:hypothetical protein [Rhodanobacter sp. PCA2]